MLTTCLPFLLLPAVVYSRISIKIIPGKTPDDVSVDFSGSDTSVISDKERKTFGLTDENLKNATEKYEGKRCDDVYVKPPTPWGDVYSKYNWDIVERTIKPVKARVLSVKSKSVAVASTEYVNNRNIEFTSPTSVTQKVEETVRHTWSSGGELSVGQEINYNINFGAENVGATSLPYSSTWGKNTTKSRTVTLGTTYTVSTTIPPKSKVVAVLTALQGKLEIEIDYEAKLNDGDVFCNYAKKYEDHHFYAFPLRRLQFLQDLPITMRTTEKISVGFYTNARLEVNDGASEEEIQEEPAGIIKVGPTKIIPAGSSGKKKS